MTPFEYYILLAIGVLLIGIETLLFSFYLLWIGIGFVLTAVVSIFLVFGSAWEQIAVAVTIAMVLLLLLRKKMVAFMKKKGEIEEVVAHTGGIATYSNGSFKMDGTYWHSDDDLSTLKEGDKVTITIKEGKAFIVK